MSAALIFAAPAHAQPVPPVCDRTPQVRDGILGLIGGVNDCADVTDDHLSRITALSPSDSGIATLKAGDFSGLGNLEWLYLQNNPLSILPSGVFSGLGSLRGLFLESNQLSTLPSGVFSGLGNLEWLYLQNNPLSTLPAGIFVGLTLSHLILPPSVALPLRFIPVDESGEPASARVTVGLAQGAPFEVSVDLFTVNATLSANSISIPQGATRSEVFTVRRENPGEVVIVGFADATLDAPPNSEVAFSISDVSDVFVMDGVGRSGVWIPSNLMGGVVSVREGATAMITVRATPAPSEALTIGYRIDADGDDATADADGNDYTDVTGGTVTIGAGETTAAIVIDINDDDEIEPPREAFRVVLEAPPEGAAYVLASPEQTTAIVVINDEGVCDRTPQVRDEILRISGVNDCADVTDDHLSRITALSPSDSGIATLKAGDFSGLGNLEWLYLQNNALSILPSGVFSGLGSLRGLFLESNQLSTLPSGVFSGLGNLEWLYLQNNPLSTLPAGIFVGLTLSHLILPPSVALPLRFIPVDESGEPASARVTVGLAQGAPFEVSVDLFTVNATLSANSISIPQGATRSEVFTVRRENPGEVVIVGFADATLDAPPNSEVAFSISDVSDVFVMDGVGRSGVWIPSNLMGGVVSVREGATAMITVRATPAPSEALTIGYRIDADGDDATTDADGNDYTDVTGGTVTIGAGETTAAIVIDINDDDEIEPPREAFRVVLEAPPEGAAYVLASPEQTTAIVVINDEGVCDRTPQVRDEILRISGVNDCADVTDDHSSRITALSPSDSGIATLKAGDFSGLGNLEWLYLQNNALSILPSGVFSGLGSLRGLFLESNQLSTLPSGVFSGLGNLEWLYLQNNPLSTLPAGIFVGLTLSHLILPPSVALPLRFIPVDESGEPASARVTVGLAQGAPFEVSVDLFTVNATLSANSVSIPQGATRSEVFTVWRENPGEVVIVGFADATLDAPPNSEVAFSISDVSDVFVMDGVGRSGVWIPSNLMGGVVSVREGATAMITVRATPAPSEALTIGYRIDADGDDATADADGNDYTDVTGGTVTIGAGETTAAIVIDINDDDEIEPPREAFRVVLEAPPEGAAYVLASPEQTTAIVVINDEGVCDRTPQVRDEILRISGVNDCADVTDDHLSRITALSPSDSGIATLKAGDFSGLGNLEWLYLQNNALSILPSGVFSGLGSLRGLFLESNQLSTLPSGVFSGLGNLEWLYLQNNPLSTLPAGIFVGLTLSHLILPPSVALPLRFIPVDESGEPASARVTVGLAQGAPFEVSVDLFTVNATLSANSVSIPQGATRSEVFTVWRENPGEVVIVGFADATLDAPPNSEVAFSISDVSDVFVMDGVGRSGVWIPSNLMGGVVSVREGATAMITVRATPAPSEALTIGYRIDADGDDATADADGNDYTDVTGGTVTIGAGETTAAIVIDINDDDEIEPPREAFRVVLEAPPEGAAYVLASPEQTTAIVVINDEGVCDRTPQVRDEILRISGVNDCADVTDDHLSRITALSPSDSGIATLKAGDFSGLGNLEWLYLQNNALSILPSGVFSGLGSLRGLFLESNQLSTLPSGVFSGLGNLEWLYLQNNPLSTLPAGIFVGLTLSHLILPPSVALPLRFIPVDESGEPASARVTVGLAQGAPFEVSVDLFTVNATLSANSISIPQGATRSEVFTVRRENPGEVVIVGFADATLDAPPNSEVAFSISDVSDVFVMDGVGRSGVWIPSNLMGGVVSVREGATAMITVRATPAPSEALTIGYRIDADGDDATADADGNDYTDVTGGTVTIGAGETTAAIVIDINDDDEIEPPREAFRVVLEAPPEGAAYVLASPEQTTAIVVINDEGVCDRTPQVRDEILRISGVNDCADVTDDHLSRITALSPSDSGIATLKAGDFSGLGNLEWLYLQNNALSILPSGVFSGLGSLRGLFLESNQLSTLPSGVFSGLGNLEWLYLQNNPLSTLPAGIFVGLTLSHLILPPSVALPLRFIPVDESGEPASARVTVGLAQGAPFEVSVDLFTVNATLSANSISIPQGATRSEVFTVRRENPGEVVIVGFADATLDAPPNSEVAFSISDVSDVFVMDGVGRSGVWIPSNLMGGVVSVREGATAMITVRATPAPSEALTIGYRIDADGDDATADADGNDYTDVTGGTVTIGAGETTAAIVIDINDDDEIEPPREAFRVVLEAPPEGAAYVLASPEQTTAIVVINDEGVCDRTPQVRDEILRISGVNDCADVTDDHLSRITALSPSDSGIATLKAGDFSGLGNLEWLYLQNNALSTLPSGVFSGLGSLRGLFLESNQLSTLPSGVFSGLGNLEYLWLNDNPGVPFIFARPRLEPAGTLLGPGVVEVKLVVDEPLPTITMVTADLSAEGGVLSGPQAVILGGSTESAVFTVTQEAGAPVTLRASTGTLAGNFVSVVTAPSEMVLDVVGPSMSDVEIVSVPAFGDAYRAVDDEIIRVAVGFNEVVEVSTAVAGPSLTLTIGETTRAATYAPDLSDVSTLVFVYELQAGDADADGISIEEDALVLAGAEITDLFGNPIESASLGSHAISNAAGHQVLRTFRLFFDPSVVTLIRGGGAETVALKIEPELQASEEVVVGLGDSWGLPGGLTVNPSRVTLTSTSNGADVTVAAESTADLGEAELSATFDAGASVLGDARVTADSLTVEVSPPPVEASFEPDSLMMTTTEGAEIEVVVLLSPAPSIDVTVAYRIEGHEIDYDPAEPADYSTPLGMVTVGAGETTAAIVIDINDDDEIEPPREAFRVVLEAPPEGAAYVLASPDQTTAIVVINEGVCDRTPQVRDEILRISGVNDCADVTDDHLSGITGTLDLRSRSIATLKAGDFSGLGNLEWLNLGSNRLNTLPATVFSGLGNLVVLNLDHNQLSALPSDVFSGLGNLEGLNLGSNRLSTLPSGVFSSLGNLEWLSLFRNQLSTLPSGVFSVLGNLEKLYLYSNQLSTLPLGVFSGLGNLALLELQENALTTLPSDVFSGLGNLHTLSLSSNPGAPFVFARPRLEPTGTSPGRVVVEVKLVVDEPLPTMMTADLSAEGGVLSDSQAVIPGGSTESAVFTVTQDAGAPVTLRASTGTLTGDFFGVETAPSEMVLDVVGPSVSGVAIVSIPAFGDAYGASSGEIIRVAVGFNEVVKASTTIAGPSLALTIGETTRAATYAPDLSDVSTLVFTYMLQAGDADADGISVGEDALVFAGAEITDLFGNPIEDTSLGSHAISNAAGHQVIRTFRLFFDPSAVTLIRGGGATVVLKIEPELQDPEEVVVDLGGLPAGLTVNPARVTLTPTSNEAGITVAAESTADLGEAELSATFDAGASVLGDARVTADSLTVEVVLPPEASFEPDSLMVTTTEGAEATVVVSLSQELSEDVTVAYRIEGHETDGYDSAEPADYSMPLGMVTIEAGETTVAIVIDINDDEEIEPTREAFRVVLEAPPESASYMLASPDRTTAIVVIKEGVCDRTAQIRDEILRHIGGVNDCAEVTDDHLSGITGTLDLRSRSIATLKAGDFSGLGNLRELDLMRNQLTTLPSGVFSGLSNLGRLELQANSLTTLPVTVFSGLGNLERLFLYSNQLSTLPLGVFSGLGNLEVLDLRTSQLSALLATVFSGLDNLEWLYLNGNQLTTLPAGVFSGLGSLRGLFLGSNQLSTLPSGVFSGLGNLEYLWLNDNPGVPFIFARPRLEPAGTLLGPGVVEVKLVVDEPLPTMTMVTADLSAEGGVLSGPQAVILGGSTESAVFTVTQEAGAPVTLRASTGTLAGNFVSVVTAPSEMVLDVVGPSVSDVAIVSIPASGDAYRAVDGEVIRVAVGFDEVVEVSTTIAGPSLTLTIGKTIRAATYVPGLSGDTTLVFTYALQTGDADADGISIEEDALVLAGAEITDLFGNRIENTGLGSHAILNAAGHQVIRTFRLFFDPSAVTLIRGGGAETVVLRIEPELQDPEEVVVDLGGPRGLTGGLPGGLPEGLTVNPARATLTSTSNEADVTVAAESTADLGEAELSATLDAGASVLGNARVTADSLTVEVSLPAEASFEPDSLMTTTTEGAAATVVVSLSRELSEDVTIAYRIEGHEADGYDPAEPADYSMPLGVVTVTIEVGATTAAIVIDINDDEEIEPTREAFKVVLEAPPEDAAYVLASPDQTTAIVVIKEGVCDRTPQIQDGILWQIRVVIRDVNDCAEVMDDDLSGVTDTLNLGGANIATLKAGDFSGLGNLEMLELHDNQLSTLPATVFSGLGNLGLLYLYNNSLSTLPAGVFSGLGNLETLDLRTNQLSALLATVFSGLDNLRELNLRGNQLTTLPAGVFSGLGNLGHLDLRENPGVPFVFARPRLEPTGTLPAPGVVGVKLVVDETLPTMMTADLSAEGGVLSDPQAVIPGGSTESAVFTVTQEAGAPVTLRASTGTLTDFLGVVTALSELVLDVVGPSVSDVAIVSIPASGDAYRAVDGEVIRVAVGFDEVVEVSTTIAGPSLALTIGETTRAATYVPGLSGDTTLVFTYALQTGDADADGISIEEDALVLAGAEITDLFRNTIENTGLGSHAILNAAGHQVIRTFRLFFAPSAVTLIRGGGVETVVLRIEPELQDPEEAVVDLGDPAGLPGGLPAGLTVNPARVTLTPASNEADITVAAESTAVPGKAELSATFDAGASVLGNARVTADSLTVEVSLPAEASFEPDSLMTTTTEGAAATVVVSLSRELSEDVTVAYRIEWHEADGYDSAEPADYSTPLGVVTVTIEAGETTAAIVIDINDDEEIEPTREAFKVVLEAPSAGASYTLASPDRTAAIVVIKEGVCDRTPQVRDGVLRLISGVSDCADVTDDHLSGITGILDLSFMGIAVLIAGDFSGLGNLEQLWLHENVLTTLPADVFSGLGNLEVLWLYFNALTILPADVFSGLGSLEVLWLSFNDQLTTLPATIFSGLDKLENLSLWNNQMTTLPATVFSGLENLNTLTLSSNALTTLPADVFKDLDKLELVYLNNNNLITLPATVFSGLENLSMLILSTNALTALPATVFSGLDNLEWLLLNNNQLTTLPEGMFSGLSNLEALWLFDNPGAPFVLARPRLEPTGTSVPSVSNVVEVKLVVDEPLPTAIIAGLSAAGGVLSDSQAVIPGGSTESAIFTVTQEAGAPVVTLRASTGTLTGSFFGVEAAPSEQLVLSFIERVRLRIRVFLESALE